MKPKFHLHCDVNWPGYVCIVLCWMTIMFIWPHNRQNNYIIKKPLQPTWRRYTVCLTCNCICFSQFHFMPVLFKTKKSQGLESSITYSSLQQHAHPSLLLPCSSVSMTTRQACKFIDHYFIILFVEIVFIRCCSSALGLKLWWNKNANEGFLHNSAYHTCLPELSPLVQPLKCRQLEVGLQTGLLSPNRPAPVWCGNQPRPVAPVCPLGQLGFWHAVKSNRYLKKSI